MNYHLSFTRNVTDEILHRIIRYYDCLRMKEATTCDPSTQIHSSITTTTDSTSTRYINMFPPPHHHQPNLTTATTTGIDPPPQQQEEQSHQEEQQEQQKQEYRHQYDDENEVNILTDNNSLSNLEPSTNVLFSDPAKCRGRKRKHHTEEKDIRKSESIVTTPLSGRKRGRKSKHLPHRTSTIPSSKYDFYNPAILQHKRKTNHYPFLLIPKVRPSKSKQWDGSIDTRLYTLPTNAATTTNNNNLQRSTCPCYIRYNSNCERILTHSLSQYLIFVALNADVPTNLLRAVYDDDTDNNSTVQSSVEMNPVDSIDYTVESSSLAKVRQPNPTDPDYDDDLMKQQRRIPPIGSFAYLVWDRLYNHSIANSSTAEQSQSLLLPSPGVRRTNSSQIPNTADESKVIVVSSASCDNNFLQIESLKIHDALTKEASSDIRSDSIQTDEENTLSPGEAKEIAIPAGTLKDEFKVVPPTGPNKQTKASSSIQTNDMTTGEAVDLVITSNEVTSDIVASTTLSNAVYQQSAVDAANITSRVAASTLASEEDNVAISGLSIDQKNKLLFPPAAPMPGTAQSPIDLTRNSSSTGPSISRSSNLKRKRGYGKVNSKGQKLICSPPLSHKPFEPITRTTYAVSPTNILSIDDTDSDPLKPKKVTRSALTSQQQLNTNESITGNSGSNIDGTAVGINQFSTSGGVLSNPTQNSCHYILSPSRAKRQRGRPRKNPMSSPSLGILGDAISPRTPCQVPDEPRNPHWLSNTGMPVQGGNVDPNIDDNRLKHPSSVKNPDTLMSSSGHRSLSYTKRGRGYRTKDEGEHVTCGLLRLFDQEHSNHSIQTREPESRSEVNSTPIPTPSRKLKAVNTNTLNRNKRSEVQMYLEILRYTRIPYLYKDMIVDNLKSDFPVIWKLPSINPLVQPAPCVDNETEIMISHLSVLHTLVHVRLAAGLIRSALKLCHDQLVSTYENDARPFTRRLLRIQHDDDIESLKFVRDKLAYLWCFYAHVVWEVSVAEESWDNVTNKMPPYPCTSSSNKANPYNPSRKQTALEKLGKSAPRRVKPNDWKDNAIQCLQNALSCPLVGNHQFINLALARLIVKRSLSLNPTKNILLQNGNQSGRDELNDKSKVSSTIFDPLTFTPSTLTKNFISESKKVCQEGIRRAHVKTSVKHAINGSTRIGTTNNYKSTEIDNKSTSTCTDSDSDSQCTNQNTHDGIDDQRIRFIRRLSRSPLHISSVQRDPTAATELEQSLHKVENLPIFLLGAKKKEMFDENTYIFKDASCAKSLCREINYLCDLENAIDSSADQNLADSSNGPFQSKTIILSIQNEVAAFKGETAHMDNGFSVFPLLRKVNVTTSDCEKITDIRNKPDVKQQDYLKQKTAVPTQNKLSTDSQRQNFVEKSAESSPAPSTVVAKTSVKQSAIPTVYDIQRVLTPSKECLNAVRSYLERQNGSLPSSASLGDCDASVRYFDVEIGCTDCFGSFNLGLKEEFKSCFCPPNRKRFRRASSALVRNNSTRGLLSTEASEQHDSKQYPRANV